jgi:hypothetical protein
LHAEIVVERTFPDGLNIPMDAGAASICLTVVDRSAVEGVIWVHSYVCDNKSKTFCIYDAPNPEAVRKTATSNEVPVDKITQVSVLDPHFHK